jgi:uncharacterized protein
MKFYNREKELELLENTRKSAEESSKMTIVTGRRRIGKTSLILKSVENHSFIYFFVSKKAENLLCEEFVIEIQRKLKIKVFGEINSFRTLFEYLLESSENRHFTLIIDEFQEFYRINPSIFSDMQNLWDLYKNKSRIHLIISGSVFSLMNKIFENSKEPLFGRANEKIYLKPFNTDVIKSILHDYNPDYKANDLLTLYIVSGGVAKYLESLVDKRALSHSDIINEIFRENSFWLNEGKNLLVEEFGKDYTVYFSILSLIASSKTSRSEIESIIQKNIGGYLDRLEKDYQIIKSVKPIFARENSRNQKYYINDNFLNFWFRFVYKNQSAIEMGNFKYVKEIVSRDFNTYSGRFLERWFINKLENSDEYSIVGSYWNKKNIEIDIVALNEYEHKALIAEVKLNKDKINSKILEDKATHLENELSDYSVKFEGYSPDDM